MTAFAAFAIHAGKDLLGAIGAPHGSPRMPSDGVVQVFLHFRGS